MSTSVRRGLLAWAGALIVALACAAPPLRAAPLNPNRPVDLEEGPEVSLQGVLDQMTADPGALDAVADQSEVALWHPGPGVVVASLLFEFAGHHDSNEFGLYAAGDPGNRVTLFSGDDAPLEQREITFLEGGIVEVWAGPLLTTQGGFKDGFGFYLHSGEDDLTFFSEDALNGGSAQALVYPGDGQTILQPHPSLLASTFGVDEWIIAFEDLPQALSDFDYNDLIVHVANLHAGSVVVAEPYTALLLGFGILAFGAARRRAARRSAR